MSRISKKFDISQGDMNILEQWVKSRTVKRQYYERAKIVIESSKGRQPSDIARELNTYSNKVIHWRNSFIKKGLEGLEDKSRSGRSKTYDEEFKNKVIEIISTPAPKGYGRWDAPLIAKHLNSSKDAVWRVLKKEGISLSRQRSWCISNDKEFVAKAADIIGLYLAPPLNALVLCVDEKPSIQALERKTGFIETDDGKIVRAYQSTYKRNGTLNLFAALNIAAGKVITKTTDRKTREEFQKFMDEVIQEYGIETEIHVILDNYSTHKRNHEWQLKYPNLFFHFTPTSASWLNMVEIWFGIFTRKSLRGASFKNTQELAEQIRVYTEQSNKEAKPFKWKKREVKGSQLKNNIVNLRN